KSSPNKTVVPTALKINVMEPITEARELYSNSLFVNILKGLGNPFSVCVFDKRIIFSSFRAKLDRFSLFNKSNNVTITGPMVMPRKKEVKTVVPSGTTPKPQYKCRNP